MAVGDQMEATQNTQGIMDLDWTQDDEQSEPETVEEPTVEEETPTVEEPTVEASNQSKPEIESSPGSFFIG